jgi:putative lipase involved disintegration of autophagic bodies
LVITGHSLGGGLASAASLATGIRAETFNAAGLNSSTAKQHKLDMKKAETLITAHYTMNDELSYLKDANFYQVCL